MDILKIHTSLCKIAPIELAESWDNVGVLVDCQADIKKVLVALDITAASVAEAIQNGCGLIVSHHPVIFSSIKSICADDVVYKLIQNGVSAICMHTNLDAANGGVNDLLARKLGLLNIKPLECGGRVGVLPNSTNAKSFAQKCKIDLSSECVRYTDIQKPIQSVCVVGGSGAFLAQAKAAGADCLVTGDTKHHDAIDAIDMNIALIGASHFATEILVVDYIIDVLKKDFADLQIIKSDCSKEPLSQI